MPTPPPDINEVVERALAEDVGPGDLTVQAIDASKPGAAYVVTREDAVLCGQAWFDAVFRRLDPAVRIGWQARDGDAIATGSVVCDLTGIAAALLTGERTALNFLQLLSGIATRARAYVNAVRGSKALILDTRKTLPGLRSAQKYAVACGGGQNHRMGLYDAVLIKENHIAAAGSLRTALERARAAAPKAAWIEVEVENHEQLREALAAGAKRILLDNFSLADLRAAVAETAGRAALEFSGGVTVENVRAVADTGVTYISIGDLTKNVRATDFSMRFK